MAPLIQRLSGGGFGRAGRHATNELFPTGGWRLLLPELSPEQVVALGDGPTAATARRLWPRPATGQRNGRPPDLVVGDSSDDATVAAVAELVGPTTMAYLQFDWPRHRSYDQLLGRLERAGLPVRVLYSISLGRHRWAATWWIPIDSRNAAQLVAGRLASAGGRSETLADRLRGRLLTHWQQHPDLVARRPWILHPSRKQQLGVVIAGHDIASTGSRAGTTIMKIGGSSTDQPILFTFGHGPSPAPAPSAGMAGEPDVVVKVPTLAEEIESSRREAEVLTALARIHPPVSQIPRPVDVRRYREAGLHAFGQTNAPGRPMALVVTPESLPEHAVAVGEWLVELAGKTAGTIDSKSASTTVHRRLAELESTLGGLPDGAELSRRLAAAAGGIDRNVTVHRHNDLGPWNVHVTATGEITVIDWADATPAGMPACDFIHFLAHLGLCAYDAYRPDRRDRVIADLVDSTSPLGRRVWQLTADHVIRVGLTPDRIPHLRMLTWAFDLLRRPPRQRTSGLYLELLRAEIRAKTSHP